MPTQALHNQARRSQRRKSLGRRNPLPQRTPPRGLAPRRADCRAKRHRRVGPRCLALPPKQACPFCRRDWRTRQGLCFQGQRRNRADSTRPALPHLPLPPGLPGRKAPARRAQPPQAARCSVNPAALAHLRARPQQARPWSATRLPSATRLACPWSWPQRRRKLLVALRAARGALQDHGLRSAPSCWWAEPQARTW